MTHSARLVDLVSDRLSTFVDDRASILTAISPDLAPFVDYSKSFLSGGKRFRALFAYWGWKAVTDADPSGLSALEPASDESLEAIVSIAAALEMFHAAALVHDDIMDNSDTRRGAPAAHVLFSRLHSEARYLGAGDTFGRSAALLFGDLMLGWSDELLDEGLAMVTDRAAARMTRFEYNLMRTEVTVGQYLDVLEESAWRSADDSEQRARAERVILYKSAKYSVEAPLLIGAALGGATARERATLSSFGRPIGLAFQLRDDLLGVFGDSAVTGKPAGDDLIEGKRTVLIAIARERLSSGARALLDELLGDANLTLEQVTMLQNTIRDSGALEEVEQQIQEYVQSAETALGQGELGRSAVAQLHALAQSVAHRES